MSTSVFKFVEPVAATNLITNPSFETNASGWLDVGPTSTFARSTAWQARGAYSLHVITGGAGQGAQSNLVTLVSGQSYAASIYIRVISGTWRLTMTAGTAGDSVSVTATSNQVHRMRLDFDANANTSSRLFIECSSGVGECYVDAAQFETTDETTTYIDGDQDGCVWTGNPHASTSRRSAQTRSGGRERFFDGDFGTLDLKFEFSNIQGIGFAPISHLTHGRGARDGHDFQGVRANPIVISVTGWTIGGTTLEFHEKHQRLVRRLAPDLVSPPQPVRLIYSPDTNFYPDRVALIDAHYLGGAEIAGLTPPSRHEEFTVQFVAYEPRWTDDVDRAVDLTLMSDEATGFFIHRTGPDDIDNPGDWQGDPGNNEVHAILVARSGKVYCGGDFTSLGGTAANRIIEYDPEADTWAAMGTGASSGSVVDIAEAPNGDIFIVGDFASVGGVANTAGVARWDGSSWNSLSAGTLTPVDIATCDVAPNGDLYVGGGFTTIGGKSIARIARWNSGGFFPLHATGATGTVQKLRFALDGSLFVGGNISAIGNLGSVNRIATYNVDTGLYADLDGGVNSTVLTITFGPDGRAYVGGNFTSDGSSTKTLNHIAVWDGNTWSQLGDGLGDTQDSIVESVQELTFDYDGTLIAGGSFSNIPNQQELHSRIARWDGANWAHLDVDLPGSPSVRALGAGRGRLYIGLSTEGESRASSVTSAFNYGTAVAHPWFRFRGPTRIRSIRNWDQGTELILNTQVLDGEEVVIDTRPGKLSVRSDLRANKIATLFAGSELAEFGLLPQRLEGGTPNGTRVSVYAPPLPLIKHRGSKSATSTNSTGVTVTRPDDVANGDLLVATVNAHGGAARTITRPTTTWTLMARTDSGNTALATYYKVASSEPGSYQWTIDTSTGICAAVSAFTGASTAAPFITIQAATRAASTSHNLPTTTGSTRTNTLALAFVGTQGSTAVSFTAPRSFGEIFDVNNTKDLSIGMFDVIRLAPGDDGGIKHKVKSSASVAAAVQLAVFAETTTPESTAEAQMIWRNTAWSAELSTSTG